ncbi:MAG: DUF2203 domain-containing protein [Bacteroidota bacterium]|nr:DUF2203 domain-containing protein [Bacteroidota bacterium]MDP4229953.1 DUF2203 domain-containing protein [Bacteroidota bacterium]MDP4235634.1 DUF2203 domain-containing protein [Bacteroidota bacterium]
MQYTKHFTVAEAVRELPLVISVIREIAALKSELDRKGYDVYRHQYFGGIGPNGQKVFPPEMEELVAKVRELNERGIEIKDLDKGLIDFPALRANGEEVYLCYMLGEETILAWHPLEGGFAGRQPITDL